MLSFHWSEVKLLRDDCVSWEELSCNADGEGAEGRVAALLELRSVSSNHIWVPGLLEACTGLWRLLELWLDMPLGLGGLLGVSEVSSVADPIGEENWSSLRLVVRKLVLKRKKEIHYTSRHLVPPPLHPFTYFTTTFTMARLYHFYTYKSLCDLTMAFELPLWRKDDWPPETMVRSCL